MGPLHMAWIGCQVPIIMSEAAPLVVEVAAGTDLGCVRASTKDSCGYDLARQIYVVCDGMGHGGGRGGPCPLELQQGRSFASR
jgi:hypothetical protein